MKIMILWNLILTICLIAAVMDNNAKFELVGNALHKHVSESKEAVGALARTQVAIIRDNDLVIDQQ